MSNPTILIADDELSILNALVEYLEAQNFTIITASDGESALNMFEEASPDMAIIDVKMPKMNGDIVCQKIREQSDIPIIAMTGQIEEGEVLRLLNLGADNCIKKPFKLTELSDRLQLFQDITSSL